MDTLQQVKHLLNELTDIDHNSREELAGTICLDESCLQYLKKLVEAGVIYDTLEQNRQAIDINRLNEHHFGQSFQVTLQVDELERSGVVIRKNLDELLETVKYRFEPPKCFILLSSGQDHFVHPRDEPSGKLKHYFDLTRLLTILKDKADHLEAQRTLLFLHKGILAVPIEYQACDLEREIGGYEVIEGIFAEEGHQDEKRYILHEALTNTLAHVSQQGRLSHLIAHFSDFLIRFDQGYRLFVANFSYQSAI